MPYPDQPKDTPIPSHLDRWNWGAFLLNWIWGLGHNTYIALLMFVPIVNFVMVFVLGAKGSKWAWKNRLWADEEHFVRTQRNWARAGLIVLVAFFLLGFAIFYGVFSLMKSSEAYKLSMEEVLKNPQVIEELGEPIEAGWFVSGNINLQGINGNANFSIPVSGPKCSGTVISRSIKEQGVWDIYLLVLKSECSQTPIVLKNTRNLRVPGAERPSGGDAA